jgi:bifunctional UDP-N-acetylglucosamine pyrophosphorylase/glucosamine-1-phosphate N-acetyltransferase
MFSMLFEQPTLIDNEQQLRELFKTDRLSLGASSTVVFEGRITLGSEILFAGDCILGNETSVGNGCILTSVALGIKNKVRPYSIVSNLKAGSSNLFGPFCFIRDECEVADNCIIGSHVETARSIFASGVKISHHAFVGDAIIGERTIIGAGVVFCNYDGHSRQVTTVESDVTIGSGVLLVAPIFIGENSLIAAGSVVTKDVPKYEKIIQKRQ